VKHTEAPSANMPAALFYSSDQQSAIGTTEGFEK
jgi:hypothetical protein